MTPALSRLLAAAMQSDGFKQKYPSPSDRQAFVDRMAYSKIDDLPDAMRTHIREWEATVQDPSPRGRGRHMRKLIGYLSTGSIPAWAGETLCTAWRCVFRLNPATHSG